MIRDTFFDWHRFVNVCRKEMVEGWKANLLRHVAEVPQIFCQFDRLLERGTRMGGHQVRNEVLLHSQRVIHRCIFLHELAVNLILRFSHPL